MRSVWPSGALRATSVPAIWLLAPGLAVGVLAALGLTRLLAGFLFGVEPWDPATYAGVCLLLAGVACVASFAPARRAARMDPMRALRLN